MTEVFSLYRFDHGDGTAKEWAVRYLGNGQAETRWGKAGHLSGSGVFPSSVAMKREDEKEKKGYRHIGKVHLDDFGRHVQPAATQQGRAPAQPPAPPPAPKQKCQRIDIAALLGGDEDGFYF
ncbi:MAG TPA: hypothetical protein VLM84_02045 [Chromatiaceae bacterium]|nr:hypothetical protein [Chromatiaceae bacterium]